MVEDPEHDFLGKHRDKMWTYFILMALLIVIVVVINVVWQNPTRASEGMKHFMGLPGWALALITAAVGGLICWGGLKVAPDWPEALGAFMISGAIVWLELIVGWKHFDIGGIVVIPYVIPLVVFLLLLMYGIRNSR